MCYCHRIIVKLVSHGERINLWHSFLYNIFSSLKRILTIVTSSHWRRLMLLKIRRNIKISLLRRNSYISIENCGAVFYYTLANILSCAPAQILTFNLVHYVSFLFMPMLLFWLNSLVFTLMPMPFGHKSWRIESFSTLLMTRMYFARQFILAPIA